jgi:hypothetical protein
MDRIIRREPNAYLAALYWDSEMFKHATRNRRELEAPRDYKAEVFKLLNNPRKHFVMRSSLENAHSIIKLLLKYGPIIEPKEYRTIYDCLVAGDPKKRTLRGIITNINTRYADAGKKEKEHGKQIDGAAVHFAVGRAGKAESQ